MFNGIAFNKAELFPAIHAGKRMNICYTIEDNKHHSAQNAIQLQIKEIQILP